LGVLARALLLAEIVEDSAETNDYPSVSLPSRIIKVKCSSAVVELVVSRGLTKVKEERAL
jgi:hypothetical protein